MSKETEGCLGAIVFLFIALPISAALYAWAAMLNWNWFATTLGAHRIGFFQAYGLSLVISSFVGNAGKQKKDDRELGAMAFELCAYTVARFIIYAGCGWIVHGMMMA